MVGSLAECFAEYYYDLNLYPCSNPGHDAHLKDCKVEIKATQGNRVALRSGPEMLLVFSLHEDGSFEEVYNGPGAPVWALVDGRKPQKNGQFQVTLTKLKQLMKSIPREQRLKRVRLGKRGKKCPLSPLSPNLRFPMIKRESVNFSHKIRITDRKVYAFHVPFPVPMSHHSIGRSSEFRVHHT